MRRFILELVEVEREGDVLVRLRRLLKAMLRGYGLRCTSCREVRNDEEIKQGVRGGDLT